MSKKRLRLAAIIVAAVVILGGGATAVALTVAHTNEVAAQEAAAQAAQDAEDAKAAKAAASARAKEAADASERDLRATEVVAMEASITTDAQGRVTDGTLEGPITKTSCTPLGGGSTDILTALTTTFTCIAINEENADGTYSGYGFAATMDWSDGSYSWQLGD